MEFSSIQSGVLSLIGLLEGSGRGQIEGLSQFVSVAMVDQPLDLQGLRDLLQSSTQDRLRSLVDFANRRNFLSPLRRHAHSGDLQSHLADFSFGPGSDGNASMVTKSAEFQFGVIYSIYVLREMVASLSFNQLVKIVDLVPPEEGPRQLQHLQDLQQLLLQLDVGHFLQVQEELKKISQENPGGEAEALPQLVDLGASHFHLYESLRQMMSMTEDDFVVIQSSYPGWSHLQIGLLTKLRSLSIHALKDFYRLLVSAPPSVEDKMDLEDDGPALSHSGSLSSGVRTEGALSLFISDQPPEKCVYKRNVKPPPSVTIEGNMKLFDGNVYVVPILSRCDSAEDLPNMMAGNGPVKLAVTRVVTFSRLKVLATTHQLNETLFALRFELRRYNGDDFQVLDSVTTEPFTVVSHSTQLKPSHKNLPAVSDVIPDRGPASGSTRVAILGTNFQDSPTTRVKFGDYEVMPIFHTAKTLIVHTPKHEPGPVRVYVCNEPNAWSAVAGSFTYSEPMSPDGDTGSHKVAHSFSAHSPSSEPSNVNLYESFGAPKLSASQAMDFDLGSSSFIHHDPNKLDSRGYSALHYACAYGNMEQLRLLSQCASPAVNVMVRDKRGNSALHWAVRNRHLDVVRLLLRSAPPMVNALNNDIESALHWAARNGDDDLSLKIALLLLQSGANVNAQDSLGLTPLHFAAADGLGRMAMLLLRSGADPTFATYEDELAPIHLAAICNRPAALIALAQNGSPLNLSDNEGDNALHWAYRSNSQEAVAALLQLGAQQGRNVDGELPSELALAQLLSAVVSLAALRAYCAVASPFSSKDSAVMMDCCDAEAPLAYCAAAPSQTQQRLQSALNCLPAPALGRSYASFGVYAQ